MGNLCNSERSQAKQFLIQSVEKFLYQDQNFNNLELWPRDYRRYAIEIVQCYEKTGCIPLCMRVFCLWDVVNFSSFSFYDARNITIHDLDYATLEQLCVFISKGTTPADFFKHIRTFVHCRKLVWITFQHFDRLAKNGKADYINWRRNSCKQISDGLKTMIKDIMVDRRESGLQQIFELAAPERVQELIDQQFEKQELSYSDMDLQLTLFTFLTESSMGSQIHRFDIPKHFNWIYSGTFNTHTTPYRQKQKLHLYAIQLSIQYQVKVKKH